jgi:hypothetical protein
LPFYYASVASTVVFAALFFGCYYVFTKTSPQVRQQAV